MWPLSGDTLRRIVITVCEQCLTGAGGECHTPGCALWMNRAPDVPLTNYELLAEERVADA